MASDPAKVNRRRFLTRSVEVTAAATLGTGLYAWRVEPHWVEVTHHTMRLAGMPASWAGKQVVQISDLHCGPVVDRAYLKANLARVRAMRPDLLLITGDWMTCYSQRQIDETVELIREADFGMPVCGVLGNHDYGSSVRDASFAQELTTGLRDLGVQLLRNEVVEIDGLAIGGVDDLYSRDCQVQTVVTALSKPLNAGRDAVLMCHNPDTIDRRKGWDNFRGWILSGHTHGGQCNLPGYGAPVVSIRNRRYLAGLVDLGNDRKLYVNRALGYKQRLRFNARPEITVFHLESA